VTRYIPALATTNYGDPFPNGLGTPHAVPPDTEWAEQFFQPRPPMPILLAEKGYDWRSSIAGRPHYYLDAAGFYRDTLTDSIFDGPSRHAVRPAPDTEPTVPKAARIMEREMDEPMKLPEGSKVTKAQVLRRFAANIHYAASLGTAAAAPYRRAWVDAIRRARAFEART
jgi:hypothetical protein